ncbi:unnamed protein product [Cylicocyclus nassatus]|uniref:Uncharacterized protein n=1 Tax=Cylicocyclus nassatus TaxID=53992 RepID=A0AA36GSQ2_CYLNA|nr:unnamed protein product [Cylicocyclus nassatus]
MEGAYRDNQNSDTSWTVTLVVKQDTDFCSHYIHSQVTFYVGSPYNRSRDDECETIYGHLWKEFFVRLILISVDAVKGVNLETSSPINMLEKDLF